MSLTDILTEDMKAAMKEKEAGKLKLTVIRMVKAAVKNAEIKKKQELSEEEILEVVAREVKQRRDAIDEYKKANREDIVKTLEQEVAILMKYLPEQLSADEIKKLAQEVVAEVNPSGPRDMGKVMSKLMPKVKGKADGKLVNEIVRKLLG